MPPIPLSNLVPTWPGQLVPDAYYALERGLHSQRARFLFDRYLVVSLVQDLDADGITEYLHLNAGIRNSSDIAATCQRVLQHRMLEALIRVGPKTLAWKPLGMAAPPRGLFSPRIEVMAWERRGDGSGFYSMTTYVGVLEMDQSNTLTTEDLAAIGHHSELCDFLQGGGTMRRV